MTRVPRSSFRQLKRVFSGYLHQDYRLEHATPEAAVRAFLSEASDAEAARFRAEAQRFLAHTALLDFDEVRDLLARLGCGWSPVTRDALTALLSEARAIPDDRSRSR